LFEVVSVILFTLEYFLRIWVADLKYPGVSGGEARIRFILSANGIIDLLAVLPFYVPFFVITDLRFLRILRLLRVVRLFKLNRYSRSMQMVGDVLKEIKNDLIVTFSVCLLLLMVASTIMFYVEHNAQPDLFISILDSFWWAVATLTTVGYGDIYPVTGWGKFISGIIAFLGIALLALPTGLLSSAFMEKLNDKRAAALRISKVCPHCGKALND
jgi:voltage-gated potassium channel